MTRTAEQTSDQRAERSARHKRRALLALQLTITVSAFAYLLTRQPLPELLAAVRSLSMTAIVSSVALQLIGAAVSVVRWAALMRAYGATNLPKLTALAKVYLIGLFYNTYLPGAVAGDMLRGVVTRRAFGHEGATSAISVVLVERALGLAGVLVLSGSAALFFVGERFRVILPYCILGLFAVVGFVVALALGRRFARVGPGRIGRILASLPELVGYGSFACAMLLSFMTHTVVALIGHALLASVYAPARALDSFVAMPLAASMSYLPISVAGIGPRDYALVELYGVFDVPRAAATATAFAFLFSTLVVAALGGLLQFFTPLRRVYPEEEAAPHA